MAKKKINKSASIQKVFDWGNAHYGHSINVAKFNEAMEKKDWATTLRKIAKVCGTEIIYQS